MKSWPRKALLGAGLISLLAAIPASGQNQEDPESLLPPGFGDPKALPPPEQKASPTPSAQPRTPPVARPPSVQESADPDEEDELDELERPRPTNYFSIPEGGERPIDVVGLLGPGNYGMPAQAFGRSSGPFLGTLIRRLDAPLPSRWASIVLRRALLSRIAAPPGIDPVDWVAARADLLVRMGEADAARLLVLSVDQQNYTPRMIEAAARTALATSDVSGLCPLVGPARSSATVWKLADAMCAALEGEPARASALADEARRRGDIGGIDFRLAEKVIGAGAEARRAATLDWAEVGTLNPWRAGLAGAVGAEIPPHLVNRAAPEIQAWLARAPMIPLDQRLAAAATAASLGVFSSSGLVDAYSLMLDQTDIAETEGTIAARLRTAWTHRDPAERVEAMRRLWREPEAPRERYARLILTAGAAARIAPSEDYGGDTDNLIASLLSAGMDRAAASWSSIVEQAENDLAWAMLAVGAPQPSVGISTGRIEAFMSADESAGRRRSELLVAALGGIGRIEEGDMRSLGSGLGIDLGAASRWGERIDEAARRREAGTVVLLAASGMQTDDWYGVPPAHLFRILRALRTVGLEFEARMIAAEAIARL